jgi:2-dehydro-3-deoxy-D-arabinonate dehydratase
MAEAKDAGGGTFYDKVYDADRPETFFQGHPASRRQRRAASCASAPTPSWNVPEPELTLALNSTGRIFGYTLGNDMSSRDIEGENPLYLPQAKVYDRSAALGPCLLVTDTTLPARRNRHRASRSVAAAPPVFTGETTVGQHQTTTAVPGGRGCFKRQHVSRTAPTS